MVLDKINVHGSEDELSLFLIVCAEDRLDEQVFVNNPAYLLHIYNNWDHLSKLTQGSKNKHNITYIMTRIPSELTSLGLEEVWEVDTKLFEMRDQIPRSRDAWDRKSRLYQVDSRPATRLRMLAVQV